MNIAYSNKQRLKAMCTWVNAQEYFWLHEMKAAFSPDGIVSSNTEYLVRILLKELVNKQVILLIKHDKFKHYQRLKQFTFTDLKFSK